MVRIFNLKCISRKTLLRDGGMITLHNGGYFCDHNSYGLIPKPSNSCLSELLRSLLTSGCQGNNMLFPQQTFFRRAHNTITAAAGIVDISLGKNSLVPRSLSACPRLLIRADDCLHLPKKNIFLLLPIVSV